LVYGEVGVSLNAAVSSAEVAVKSESISVADGLTGWRRWTPAFVLTRWPASHALEATTSAN